MRGWDAASGEGRLTPLWSPFEIALSVDGNFQYLLEITINGLPPHPEQTGGRYVAWLAQPGLGRVERLGPVRSGEALTSEVEWNKFLVIVSAEGPGIEGAGRWAGPIVLVGRSPSAELRSLTGHSIFNRPDF